MKKADVLYLSIGTPKPAVGVDIGEGVVVRYDDRSPNFSDYLHLR